MGAGPNVTRKRRLTPRTRKLVLAAHVIVSVGWLGIVAAMLVLAITAATTQDLGMSGPHTRSWVMCRAFWSRLPRRASAWLPS